MNNEHQNIQRGYKSDSDGETYTADWSDDITGETGKMELFIANGESFTDALANSAKDYDSLPRKKGSYFVGEECPFC